jgi:hypothetical protein
MFIKEGGQGPANRQETELVGEILIRRGQLRRFQLEFLLQVQQAYLGQSRKRIPIGQLLLEHRATQKKSLREALCLQSELPAESITQILSVSDFDSENENENLTKLIPQDDL